MSESSQPVALAPFRPRLVAYTSRIAPVATGGTGAFLAIVLVFHAAGQVTAWTIGEEERLLRLISYFARVLGQALVAAAAIGTAGVLAALLARAAFVERVPRPLTGLLERLRATTWISPNWPHLCSLAFALPVLYGTFSFFKLQIPVVAPFSWDPTFARLDRTLHFGVDPYVWLHALFASGFAARLLDFAYIMWFPVMAALLAWQAVDLSRPELRRQFLLSYALAWPVLGVGLAALLSSAGPCYFSQVTGGPGTYAPLFEHLRTVHEGLIALRLQEVLWASHVYGGAVIMSGISAAPSMHVAMVTLFALFGWRIGPHVGLGLSLYAVTIFFGSVHLGWHYALDGYIGALGMAGIWGTVGWCQSARSRRPEPQAECVRAT